MCADLISSYTRLHTGVKKSFEKLSPRSPLHALRVAYAVASEHLQWRTEQTQTLDAKSAVAMQLWVVENVSRRSFVVCFSGAGFGVSLYRRGVDEREYRSLYILNRMLWFFSSRPEFGVGDERVCIEALFRYFSAPYTKNYTSFANKNK